jgi:hypothetical protein
MGIFGHILGTALSGGLFGLIGNIAAKLFAYLNTKQQFAERQAQWSYETDLLKLQMQAPTPETEKEPALAPDASWSALNETLRDDAMLASSYPWVNAVRSLVRPALTCGLAAVLAFAFFAMKAGDPERAYVIDSLVFAGVGAITWWFGDRAPKRAR